MQGSVDTALATAARGNVPIDRGRDHRHEENCLTAVSSISTVVEEAFEPYYDHFMPLLIQVLQIEATEENATLRGRAINASAS